MEKFKEFFAYLRMRRIVRFLQSPHGCEWDRAQTPESLRAHLREESEELITEINRDVHNYDNIVKEIGDVILVINLLVHSFKKPSSINLANIYSQLRKKLIFRHPHIFKKAAKHHGSSLSNSKDYWEKMKHIEKQREERNAAH